MLYGDFDKLLIEYILEADLENLTPLSIGSGKSVVGAIDNPIIRLEGKPYIPGSTLKGILRSEAERYVRTVYGEDQSYVCNILNPKEGELKRKEKLGENYVPCLVCQVFGGPTIASHVYIFDAYPKVYHTEIRNAVSINRITGGQHAGRLFDIEYVTPHALFQWKLRVINIDILNRGDKRTNLFNYLMKKLVEGELFIGSRRSVGLGQIKMYIRKVRCLDGATMTVSDATTDYRKILEEEKH